MRSFYLYSCISTHSQNGRVAAAPAIESRIRRNRGGLLHTLGFTEKN